MLFNSNIFIWLFLPILLGLYYIVHILPISISSKSNYDIKTIIKNIILVLASFIFYAWGGVYYIILIITSIVINYFAGIGIGVVRENNDYNKKLYEKIILISSIVINILLLFYFKYFNMFVSIAELIMDGKNVLLLTRTYTLPIKDVALPIGISFFTFKAMSYIIDVYREETRPQKNILSLALYISFFPQLMAGPIVKYKNMEKSLLERSESIDLFSSGIKRFAYGFGKKVIFANTFAEFVDTIYGLELNHIGSLLAIAITILYTLQIYYDFSGYSDMAIGLGQMFGFKTEENFNLPYISQSIKEFWRRWHISLSTWFRDYLYIPLGGNRAGKTRTLINLFIVFLVTGFWHGANWTFIIWGVVYGIILVVERLGFGKILDKNPIKILNVIYTFIIVNILWVLFRANNIFDAVTVLGQYFVIESSYNIMSYLSLKLIICFILGLIFMGPIQLLLGNIYEKYKNHPALMIADIIIQTLILIYGFMLIAANTYSPFIYFKF